MGIRFIVSQKLYSLQNTLLTFFGKFQSPLEHKVARATHSINLFRVFF